jgi:CHAT domain-containing protein
VVATQWVVGDEPAAELTGSLFRKLAAGSFDGFRTAQALRDAKRELRRDPRWADPFYWSPFVLSGW